MSEGAGRASEVDENITVRRAGQVARDENVGLPTNALTGIFPNTGIPFGGKSGSKLHVFGIERRINEHPPHAARRSGNGNLKHDGHFLMGSGLKSVGNFRIRESA